MHIAVEAKQLLAAQGKRVRVVSAPCWEAFSRLPDEKRAAVLGNGRLATVEAGRTLGWAAVTGPTGINIGIDHFGASAPAERLAIEFGLTGEKVASAIAAKL